MTIADTYRRTRDAAAAIAADATEQPQIRAAMREVAANNDRLLSGIIRAYYAAGIVAERARVAAWLRSDEGAAAARSALAAGRPLLAALSDELKGEPLPSAALVAQEADPLPLDAADIMRRARESMARAAGTHRAPGPRPGQTDHLAHPGRHERRR